MHAGGKCSTGHKLARHQTKMNLLIVTNIYPQQELGGYGRSIADFAWGLQNRGHNIQVLTSDAPELGIGSKVGPSHEPVDRSLKLKGSYSGGVKHMKDTRERRETDQHNAKIIRHWLEKICWDGILIGNLDLLGTELIHVLLEGGCKIQHHIGFVHPPFAPSECPVSSNYQMVAASTAVKTALINAGMPTTEIPVIYPGARMEKFGVKKTGMLAPLAANGNPNRPLKVCFAGLLMMSKGVHTLVEALIRINQSGTCVQASIAGDNFQQGYREELERLVKQENLEGVIRFVGQLKRESLARFYSLHHVGVFPSIHPEAFGIVGAEMMASGLAVISSCAGGARELIEHEKTGLEFEAGNSHALSEAIVRVIKEPGLWKRISKNGQNEANKRFSVEQSARLLETGFKKTEETKKIMFR